jgi:tetratricopeptide (TPR) repeat protein
MTLFSRMLIGAAALALIIAPARAQSDIDRVQRRNGIDLGTITTTNALGVTISKGGVTSKIPAEEIRTIQFAGEPSELNAARTQLERGRYDLAKERLAKIDRTKITRDEISQELDYALALCEANLALAGKADREAALAQMSEFLTTHRNSYHVAELIALQGDLYQVTGDIAAARKKYETLAKAPTPYYKAQSALLVGKLLQDEGKHAEALPQFEIALKEAGTSGLAADIRRAAVFSSAASLAAVDKIAEATDAIRKIIEHIDPDDTTALAQSYNALGASYQAAGDLRAARDAYLHVDLLFNSAGPEHAESLYRLTHIWKELRQPTRAQDAQQRLTDDYALSRWAGR